MSSHDRPARALALVGAAVRLAGDTCGVEAGAAVTLGRPRRRAGRLEGRRVTGTDVVARGRRRRVIRAGVGVERGPGVVQGGGGRRLDTERGQARKCLLTATNSKHTRQNIQHVYSDI